MNERKQYFYSYFAKAGKSKRLQTILNLNKSLSNILFLCVFYCLVYIAVKQGPPHSYTSIEQCSKTNTPTMNPCTHINDTLYITAQRSASLLYEHHSAIMPVTLWSLISPSYYQICMLWLLYGKEQGQWLWNVHVQYNPYYPQCLQKALFQKCESFG